MDPDRRAGVLLGSATTTVVSATIMLDPDPSGNMVDGSPAMWLQLAAVIAAMAAAAIVATYRSTLDGVARQYAGALLGTTGALFLLAPLALWVGPVLLIIAGTSLVWAGVGLGIGHLVGALLPRRLRPLPALPESWSRWPAALLGAAIFIAAAMQGPGPLMAAPITFVVAWLWGTTAPARPARVGAIIGTVGALSVVAWIFRYGATFDTQRWGLDAAVGIIALGAAVAACAWLTAQVCVVAASHRGQLGKPPMEAAGSVAV